MKLKIGKNNLLYANGTTSLFENNSTNRFLPPLPHNHGFKNKSQHMFRSDVCLLYFDVMMSALATAKIYLNYELSGSYSYATKSTCN